MATTNILTSVPEDVLNAAKIALNKDVTTANDVGNGVMFGGNHSYEDDDWVKIVYDAEGNISKITKPHPFSDTSEEDITNTVLDQIKKDKKENQSEETDETENQQQTASVKKKRLIKRS